jgi:DNA-3-methyladenine glycosylase I
MVTLRIGVGVMPAGAGGACAGGDAVPDGPACRRSQSPMRTGNGAPRSIADIPSSTPQAEALGKQLKAHGYRFVGPTSVYAFMQNVGMVNDHVRGCFRATGHGQSLAGAGRGRS